jgi:hypothetical protein
LRQLPDFVILGTARGGTSSLYRWLITHPDVSPASKKELHFFDVNYGRGMRWYRAQFPLRRRGKITGEATPYMLFHPLAPERAARDLPVETKFIVLLREPTQRAISHYWFWRQWFKESLEPSSTETLEEAIEREPARMASAAPRVLQGERSLEHEWFSYASRGAYAEQLQRWFDAVGRDRVLVLESEKLYTDPTTSERVLEWLGLAPNEKPYPVVNGAARLEEASPELVDRLDRHFDPLNRELFDLLGFELWSETGQSESPGAGTP